MTALPARATVSPLPSWQRVQVVSDASLDGASFAVDQLQFNQLQQITGMIGAVASALARHLVILAQHRRQLQLLKLMGEQHLVCRS